jgi:cell division septal protein FtsQ
MRRRRKRRQIAWGPVLTILLVVNIVAGVFASKLTSIVKVRVEGAQLDDQSRIRALLQRIHDQPALKVNRFAVESNIAGKSAVSKVEMTRNIFGRALVTVEYRRPVAKIAGLSGAALARDGVIFQSSQDLTGLPTVVLSKDAKAPTIALAGSWRSGEVAGLAGALVDLSAQNPVEIITLENGGLCLNIGSKFAVELGLPERLDDKVEYFKKQIEDDPSLLMSGRTLILVSLERPSYRAGVEKSK